MGLACNNSKKVTLKYTSVIPNKIQYLGLGHTQHSRPFGWPKISGPHSFEVSSPNPDTELTWDFTLSHDNSHFIYDVTVNFANPNSPEPSATFPIYLAGTFSQLGFWYNENGTVYWKFALGDPPVVRNSTNYVRAVGSQTGFRKVDSSSDNAGSTDITSISVGGPTINPELGYAWIMNIFADGNLFTTKIVRSSDGSPPESGVKVIDALPGYQIEKDFLYLETEQGFKLEKVAEEEYLWKLIKFLPGDTSGSTDEEIFSFHGLEPDLLCFVVDGECPEGTCQVDCGDHYCCYEPTGISVYSFNK
ncbi:hypothetical protein Xen7305DRAFT_00045500 [Xenococcus sp. PCC 7305]|uniref:hypothetical protein n=1 Tax=Xenococcus sp. PCC 7305 TaxID=102125 RepID=UPI0002AC446E|nr:hypothetical protein [Xenococcus sp. PCC 7305]ELS04814.1 hypothetical protein Xen7305DRAFT_00045500 [Xenococcus sp. PCC 7305]